MAILATINMKKCCTNLLSFTTVDINVQNMLCTFTIEIHLLSLSNLSWQKNPTTYYFMKQVRHGDDFKKNNYIL